MTLHDKLYFRFGLFHRRWGHAIAYMLEFLLVALVCFLVLLCLVGFVRLTYGVYRDYTEAQKKVAQAQAQKVVAEQMLLDCLNGRIVGKAVNGEYVACEGAMTFRM